jgi:hypothetical protein
MADTLYGQKTWKNRRCIMDEKRFKNSSDPLCRFGPGGEFTSDWPVSADAKTSSVNSIGRVLSTIAGMIGATIYPELLAEIENETAVEMTVYRQMAKEKTSSERKQFRSFGNASSTQRTQGDRCHRGQSMLFADDCRGSRKAKRKSQHRIRTCRRVTKKKTSNGLQGQGSLFETNSASQSAA